VLVIADGRHLPPSRVSSPTTRSPLGFRHTYSVPLAVAAIVFLAGINYIGVRPAAITQNNLTVLETDRAGGADRRRRFARVSYRSLTSLTRPSPSLGGAPVGCTRCGASRTLPAIFAYRAVWNQRGFIPKLRSSIRDLR